MTVSAATIDAYLRTGRTPRAIADWYSIPLAQVLTRVEIMARRKADHARRALERARAIEADRRESRRRGGIDAWLKLDIRYEDEPTDPPFDYSQAWMNTQKLLRSRPQTQSYGGGVSSVYEARGFDFHAGSKAA